MPASDDEGRAHRRARLTLLVYLIALAVLIVDQATKLAAINLLQPNRTVPVLGRYLSLTWATNTGGAFGIMPAATAILIVIAIVVIIALAILARQVANNRLLAAALACLLGGALGNLLDRIRLGHVIDFIDVHFWPIFNVADIAITVGAGLLIIASIAGAMKPASPPPEDE